MKNYRGLVFGFLLACAAASPGLAEMDYEINFLLGQKALEEDDWAPLEDHVEFGVAASFGKTDWPVQIAIDVLGSADDGPFLEATTSEFDVGVRKIWRRSNMSPFVGGGLAFVNGELEEQLFGTTIDDDGTGAWVDGGVFWRLGRRFNIGIEARISRAEITLGAFDYEAGGDHLALVLGFGKARD